MISAAFFIGAAIIAALSAVMFTNAKSGPQQTLGGVVALVALLVASLGALMRVAGIHY